MIIKFIIIQLLFTNREHALHLPEIWSDYKR